MFPLLALIVITVLQAAGPAPSTQLAPAAIAHWVGENGVVETQRGSALKTEWTWVTNNTPNRKSPLDDPDPTIGPATPVLRVYLHTRAIPENWNFTEARSDNAQLVTLQKAQGADPRLRRLVIDARATIANLDLDFNGDGRPRHLKLALTIPAQAPFVYLHPSCKDFEVKPIVKRTPNSAQHLFLGLTCTKDLSDFYFHFLRSADSQWSYTPRTELLLKHEKDSKKNYERNPIFTVLTRDLNGLRSEHGLYCVAGTAHCKRWRQRRQPL